MSTHIIVFPDPAYGRDYYSPDDTLLAWKSGKSFILIVPPLEEKDPIS